MKHGKAGVARNEDNQDPAVIAAREKIREGLALLEEKARVEKLEKGILREKLRVEAKAAKAKPKAESSKRPTVAPVFCTPPTQQQVTAFFAPSRPEVEHCPPFAAPPPSTAELKAERNAERKAQRKAQKTASNSAAEKDQAPPRRGALRWSLKSPLLQKLALLPRMLLPWLTDLSISPSQRDGSATIPCAPRLEENTYMESASGHCARSLSARHYLISLCFNLLLKVFSSM